jgi:hypothetical protein
LHRLKALNDSTGLSFKVAQNGIEITQFMTDMGQMSGGPSSCWLWIFSRLPTICGCYHQDPTRDWRNSSAGR